jgi:hypothetical protein
MTPIERQRIRSETIPAFTKLSPAAPGHTVHPILPECAHPYVKAQMNGERDA